VQVQRARGLGAQNGADIRVAAGDRFFLKLHHLLLRAGDGQSHRILKGHVRNERSLHNLARR